MLDGWTAVSSQGMHLTKSNYCNGSDGRSTPKMYTSFSTLSCYSSLIRMQLILNSKFQSRHECPTRSNTQTSQLYVPHGTVARVGYRTTDQRDDQGEDVSDLISSAIAWFSAVIAESFCISNSSPSRPRLERLVKEAPLGDAVRPESLILLSLCTCA